MDELELVDRLRGEIPAGAGLASARRALDGEIARVVAPHRHRRLMWGVAAVATAAVVAAAVALPLSIGSGSAGSHQPTAMDRDHPGQASARPHRGVPASAVQLVDYATQAASTQRFHPRPTQWQYFKTLSASSTAGAGGMLFGPPNRRVTTERWAENNGKHLAQREHGKVVVGPDQLAGLPYGWRSISYPYLNSLPHSPQQLKHVISSAMRRQRHVGGDMFDAVQALVENVVVPPRLLAELYSVLSSLPHVHYESTATNIAGRTGVGFYEIEQGRIKHEIVSNPHTYAYMGDKYVATRDYTSVGTDRTVHVKKGQILGWNAMLNEGIVDHPGDTPSDN